MRELIHYGWGAIHFRQTSTCCGRITAFKYDQSSPFPIPPDHFHPRPTDEEGISFFQEASHTPEQLADLSNKHGWLIARIKVRDLQALGLNPKPDGDSGHVSIPELSHKNSKTNPKAVDLFKNDLAKLAAKNIVLRTPPKP